MLIQFREYYIFNLKLKKREINKQKMYQTQNTQKLFRIFF